MQVPVGDYFPDGTFKGEEVEFEGREVDIYDGLDTESEDPGDVWGVVVRLYECPDGYRVHELVWSLLPGRPAVASLLPVVEEEGYGTYYGTYTEQQAMEDWGEYFRDYFESS
jgi:hypothetical protein